MLERDVGQSVRQFEWPDDYYMETDGMRRKALLDQALAAEDTEENRMRLLLWNKRYTDHKGKYDGTDHFFRVWVDLPFIVKECNSFLGKKKAGKRKAEVLETLGLNIPEEKPEYRDVWYREFVNFCSTYIQISRNDRSYSTTLFGIGAIPEDSLLKKIAADLCKRTIEYPCLLGIGDKTELLAAAAKSAFAGYYPGREEIYEEAGKEARTAGGNN